MKRIFGQSLVYAIGNTANSAALFLLIPFLINSLSLAEYGVWSIFEVTISLLNILTLAGLEVGLMREYWFQDNEHQRARLVGSTLITVSSIGTAITLIGTGIVLGGFDLDLPEAPLSLLLVLIIGWSDAIFTIFLTLFRIREQPATFVTLSVGRMTLFVTLAIGLVVSGFGLTGALAGRLLATVVLIGVGLIFGWPWIVWQADLSQIRRIVSYGLPLLPTNLAAYLLFAVDRYTMQGFLSLEDIAIYTFSYKIAAVLDVLITRSFALDWAPRRFKIATQPNPAQKYVQILLIYLWVAIGFALVIIALTPLLYALIAPRSYWPAMDLVPIILLAYIIYGLSYPLNIGIMLKDRTRDLPVIGWLTTLCCLGLCIWWIPAFGMIGAAWATVVSYTIWTSLITFRSLRLYPVTYPWALIGGMIGVGVITYGGLWLSSSQWGMATDVGAITLRLGWVLTMIGGLGVWLWQYNQHNQQEMADSLVTSN